MCGGPHLHDDQNETIPSPSAVVVPAIAPTCGYQEHLAHTSPKADRGKHLANVRFSAEQGATRGSGRQMTLFFLALTVFLWDPVCLAQRAWGRGCSRGGGGDSEAAPGRRLEEVAKAVGGGYCRLQCH